MLLDLACSGRNSIMGRQILILPTVVQMFRLTKRRVAHKKINLIHQAVVKHRGRRSNLDEKMFPDSKIIMGVHVLIIHSEDLEAT